jgi:hypothetical protein
MCTESPKKELLLPGSTVLSRLTRLSKNRPDTAKCLAPAHELGQVMAPHLKKVETL